MPYTWYSRASQEECAVFLPVRKQRLDRYIDSLWERLDALLKKDAKKCNIPRLKAVLRAIVACDYSGDVAEALLHLRQSRGNTARAKLLRAMAKRWQASEDRAEKYLDRRNRVVTRRVHLGVL